LNHDFKDGRIPGGNNEIEGKREWGVHVDHAGGGQDRRCVAHFRGDSLQILRGGKAYGLKGVGPAFRKSAAEIKEKKKN